MPERCSDPECVACTAHDRVRMPRLLDVLVGDFLDELEHDGVDSIEQFARFVVVQRERVRSLCRALSDAATTTTDAQLKRICDRLIVEDAELDDNLAHLGPELGTVLRVLLGRDESRHTHQKTIDPKEVN